MTELDPSKLPPDLEQQDMSESDDNNPFTDVRRRKCRHRSRDSDSSVSVTSPLNELIVVLKPTDPVKLVTKLNPVKLSEYLDSIAPAGVLQIRPNPRLNLLALDTRNMESTKALLGVTILCGIPVQAYTPRSPDKAVGVIRGLPTDMTNTDVQNAVRATVPVVSARRLGSSEVVQMVFQGTKAPEHVSIGYTRFKVLPYIERPRQCTKCRRFGHIASTCQMPLRCVRCGKDHDKAVCSAEQPRCPNCKKMHESTSRRCPIFKTEEAISMYRTENRVSYASARVAVTGGGAVKPQGNARQKPKEQKQRLSLYEEAGTMHVVQDDIEALVSNDTNFPPLSGDGVPTTLEKSRTHQRRLRKASLNHTAEVNSSSQGLGSALSTILLMFRNMLQLIDLPFAKSLVTILDTVVQLTGLLTC